jgi:Xaa-Pro aminopeptidase
MGDSNIFPPIEDLKVRWGNIQSAMQEAGVDACVVTTNANMYYLTGMVFGGYIYLRTEGLPIYFTKRPLANPIQGVEVVSIRKPEDIPSLLQERGVPLPKYLLLEADELSFSEHTRLQNVFTPERTGNATIIIRRVRMIKTPWEVEQFRISAKRHSEAYAQIPLCYHKNISDVEFQYNIEKVMRSKGSIGFFRGFGNMEIHMGSVLAGDYAEQPSPVDFALGGQGMHPSIPIGANGTILKHGTTVMIDMGGNFTAYLTDMTRVYSIGKLPELAYRAHNVALEIQEAVINKSKPDTPCADLYALSLDMAEKAQLGKYFMGTKHQAKFVGHGVGIEINEPPVLTTRSKDVLKSNMLFALEPKFVIPNVGAVGIENTFLVTETGVEKITLFEESIIDLE